MIDKLKTTECVLCRACSTACPTEAICFDKPGGTFRYPTIDAGKCIGCQKCERVCPVLNDPVSRDAPARAYAARSGNEANRLASSSGGLFRELAEVILGQGGLVAGVVMTQDFATRHVLTRDPATVDAMRGSKYLQSDTQGIYAAIETALRSGTPVLFSGTPCQSAALRSYLKRDYDGLTVVDVICHGIPSEDSFKAYLRVMEKKYGAPAKTVQFRAKDLGWHRNAIKITFENGKTYMEPSIADGFYRGFLQNYTLKESCYDCRFRAYKSGSDLTLGDLWGAEQQPMLTKMDDNKGLSAVLVHTEKGRQLLSRVSVELLEIPLTVVEASNCNLLVSPPVNPGRADYYACAAREGEEAAVARYLMEKPAERRRRILRYRLRQCKHFLTGKKTLY